MLKIPGVQLPEPLMSAKITGVYTAEADDEIPVVDMATAEADDEIPGVDMVQEQDVDVNLSTSLQPMKAVPNRSCRNRLDQ